MKSAYLFYRRHIVNGTSPDGIQSTEADRQTTGSELTVFCLSMAKITWEHQGRADGQGSRLGTGNSLEEEERKGVRMRFEIEGESRTQTTKLSFVHLG